MLYWQGAYLSFTASCQDSLRSLNSTVRGPGIPVAGISAEAESCLTATQTSRGFSTTFVDPSDLVAATVLEGMVLLLSPTLIVKQAGVDWDVDALS